MNNSPPNNLPAQPNPMLGRESEFNAAREQLLTPEVRLLTLTGPPGVGKTRLAVAVAVRLLETFPDGVWFVDLSPLRDPALVGSAVAGILGVAEFRPDALLDSLAAYLRRKRVLLVLDNFEQVLPAAAWVGKLLERLPDLKVIATSRERLRLRWERTLLVEPLSLPDLDRSSDPAYLLNNPAVELFVQRAQAVRSDFALSPENAAVVAELCAQLDGLPLAIELAAARTAVLSPDEIMANMSRRFRMLGMGPLDLPERHQTLRAAIDWSYAALDPAESRFLRRLSVFAGSFPAEAAEAVAGDESLDLDGLGCLISLAEKSLISRAHASAGGSRFVLLESIRDYLLEKLSQSGELPAIRLRHAAYYTRLAELNYAGMRQANQKEWFDRLEIEHDNFRAALQWSLDLGDRNPGRRIAAALWYFWWLRGHVREGVSWLETFLEPAPETLDDVHLRLLEGAGTLRGWQGEYSSGLEYLMDALRIAQDWGDEAATTRVYGWLGWVLWVNGRTEQIAWLAEKVDTFSPKIDPWDLAYAYLSLGSLLYEAGLDDAAENAFEKALHSFQFAKEKHGAIFAASKLGLLKQKKGDAQAARKEMAAALEKARQLKDLHVIAYTVDDACQLLVQKAAAGLQLAEKVAWVLGAVDHWRVVLSLLRTPRERAAYDRVVAGLAQRLGEPAYTNSHQAGESGAVDDVLTQTVQLLENSHRSDDGEKGRALNVDGIQVVLSERERQVLTSVAEGLSNQEIADRLFITERTVRFHVNSIFNKLGAGNRAQAAVIAARLGMLKGFPRA